MTTSSKPAVVGSRGKQAKLGVRRGHCLRLSVEPGNAAANANLLLTMQYMYTMSVVKAFVDDPTLAREELFEKILSNVCDLSPVMRALVWDICGNTQRRSFCYRTEEGEFKGDRKVRVIHGDQCAGRKDEPCLQRGVVPGTTSPRKQEGGAKTNTQKGGRPETMRISVR